MSLLILRLHKSYYYPKIVRDFQHKGSLIFSILEHIIQVCAVMEFQVLIMVGQKFLHKGSLIFFVLEHIIQVCAVIEFQVLIMVGQNFIFIPLDVIYF